MEYDINGVAGHLRMLLEDFSNEIPEQVVHSTSPDNRFKVRKAWFQGVQAHASNLVSEGCIADQALVAEIERFTQRVTSVPFITSLTAPEDIIWADELIGKLLAAIEGR